MTLSVILWCLHMGFKVKKQEEKPRKESSKIDAADADQLDHTALQRYQLLNPVLPAQQASEQGPDVIVFEGPPENHVAEVAADEAPAEQTEEELVTSLTVALEYERNEQLTLPDW